MASIVYFSIEKTDRNILYGPISLSLIGSCRFSLIPLVFDARVLLHPGLFCNEVTREREAAYF
jgi:hypothetical protein